MSKNEIDLSIVIVSTNIEDLLRKCLRSVEKAKKGINVEVIVVDNASIDATPDMVAKEFPWVNLIRKHENHGFGENNNYGMEKARGRYVLLLNSDTEIIDNDIFRGMVDWMDNNPAVGLTSCALVNPDKKTFQGTGGSFPTLFKVFLWMSFLDDIPGLDNLVKPYHPMHGYSPFDKNEKYFETIHDQDWVTGAFFMIRKTAMESAGLFDTDFFLYVEEVELSYRIKKTGWEVRYLPQWKTLHYGMITNGSENATVMEMQNLKLFYEKHFAKWQLPVLRLFLKLGALARIIIFGVLSGSKVAKIYAKAFTTV